ncbi:MAG: site-specific DNA-methyltransferase [Chloroflexi bacterium]|nr:site-specific DNA-methyltransferase [Chloroflexota bacterium]
MPDEKELVTVEEASDWVRKKYDRPVSASNISYLIQYGQVKVIVDNGISKVSKSDLRQYYSAQSKKEIQWKQQLGEDLNWQLSFDKVREKERTKHVHRLHPYKGKFIPQLVEYFLDAHTDEYKKETYFRPGDIVLDPFCGSGTTLVQANELGLHAIGIDISRFNSLISNVKVKKHHLAKIQYEIQKISKGLIQFVSENNWGNFEQQLLSELYVINKRYFPSPKYRYQVRRKEIDQKTYSKKVEYEFQPIFNKLVNEYKLKILQNNGKDRFLDKWFLDTVRQEINLVQNLISQIEEPEIQDVLRIILSRTVRSCRATTHADLATLKSIVSAPYYCRKHYKLCKPLFSILSWWERYTKDTISRLYHFEKIRTNTNQICLTNDSRNVNIFKALALEKAAFGAQANDQKIKGIFSSPPYVGLINYHEQHAYAYDLFGFDRNDNKEIGPLYKGKGVEARNSYVRGVASVLANCQNYLTDEFDILLVANDRFNLYPQIASEAGLKIVNEFKRPVLNRTEKDKSAYAESIFHMKQENF